jgi:hypothetical protein
MLEGQEAKQMSQYELELKLDRMSQRAFGDRDKVQKPPRKPLTEVDIEVIKEYQKQFNEPVREYETEIDEETGEETIVLDEDGKPKFKTITKKFRVVPPPELDVVEIMKLAPIPTDEEIAKAQMDEITIGALIKRKEKEFKDAQQARKNAIREIDELKPPTRYLPASGSFPPRINKKYEEDYYNYELERESALDDVNKIENLLDEIRNDLINAKDAYDQGVRELRMIGQNVQRNEAELASVKKINTERIKAYQETLNLMNRGAFQQDQMPNESEKDYVARLQANAEQEYTEETLFEADMDIKRKFKEALKKLIRDDIKIEQVANSIRDNELEVKNEILKKFPLFRKKFLDIYGLNNPVISVSDIKTFIDAFIKSLSGNDALLNLIQEEPERIEENRTALELAEQDKKKVYVIENPINLKKVYFRLGANFETDALYLLFSISGKRNTYKEFIPTDADLTPADEVNSFTEIKKATGMTKSFLQTKFNNRPYSIKWIEWLAKKIEPTTNYDPIPAQISPPFDFDGKQYPETMGWGIKQEEVPDIVPFGKIKIALHKLFYKNILSARHNNLGRIAGFQNVKVSDDFVAIIMKMIRGEKVIKQEIDALQKSEQMLYDTLLSLANLHKRAPNNRDATITALKERLELVGGSIDAGNDNRALVKELYNIVHALKNFGVISNKEATKYLSQF